MVKFKSTKQTQNHSNEKAQSQTQVNYKVQLKTSLKSQFGEELQTKGAGTKLVDLIVDR